MSKAQNIEGEHQLAPNNLANNYLKTLEFSENAVKMTLHIPDHTYLLFVCLFVWLNNTRTVNPLGRFHSWCLSFTQDGLAFSTTTARRTLQVQLMWAFVCLFVWLNKSRTVKPLRRFHLLRLSFTQDGLAFSTKTARRALQVQLRSASIFFFY